MPHTVELLARLRDALAFADAADDALAAAYICRPIDILEARLAEPPEQAGSAA
jgi:hypothetical protein